MAEQIPIEQIQFEGPRADIHIVLGTSGGRAVMMFEGMVTNGDAVRAIVPEEAMAMILRAIGTHLDSIAPKPPAMILLPAGMPN